MGCGLLRESDVNAALDRSMRCKPNTDRYANSNGNSHSNTNIDAYG